MMGMADILRHEVYCGQCFEEFYGQEYCQNLRKDLEKLKDEFYDCDSQRFWCEWVVPTVNLLRRLVHMGFPIRSKDYVAVHLYNPVDSMAMGEMHFQVGRKAPGTLTLKFTKQSSSGAFVIQPKTLSNAEEMSLSMNPLAFLETLRGELRHSASPQNPSNTLRVLVLMTDSCKLQRQCANSFLAKNKSERFVDRMTAAGNSRDSASMFYQSSSTNPPISINPWAPLIPSFHPDMSIRPPPPADFCPPWNFCVKNYVNYGTKTPTAELSVHGGSPSQYRTNSYSQLPPPRPSSLAARQVSTSTCHSEPEEGDETLDASNVSSSQRGSTVPASERMAELQRRMSDVRLWDPPPKTRPTTTQQQIPTTTTAARSPPVTRVTEEYAGESPAQVPNSLPRSFSSDHNRLTAPPAPANSRRHSEPKINRVEEYFISTQSKVEDLRSSRASINEKTSLTEEYVQEQQQQESFPEVNQRLQMPQHSPQMPRLELNGHQGAAFRTDTVDSYIGDNVSTESSNDSRSRTSSLNDYVGETTAAAAASHPSPAAAARNNNRQSSSSSSSVFQEAGRQLTPLCIPFAHANNKEKQPVVESWLLHQPNELKNQMMMMEPAAQDVSILSQSSFSSWASHREYPPVYPSNPVIPLVVEKINRGEYPSWDHVASSSSSSISS